MIAVAPPHHLTVTAVNFKEGHRRLAAHSDAAPMREDDFVGEPARLTEGSSSTCQAARTRRRPRSAARRSGATSTVILLSTPPRSSPSSRVVVPQGMVQIADTLTKSEAARVDTQIGAGQALLR
jgi:hypothetical protein